MEHDYNDLQEEVNEKSQLLNKLRKRYKGALAEIQDLETEHLNEKADLLETIRTLEIDFGFYKAIVDMLLTENNLYKIKSKSSYDDETAEWKLPPFVLKGKQINLPKLGLQKAKRFVEEEKENQVVDFKQNSSQDDAYSNNGHDVSHSMIYHRTNKKKSRTQARKQKSQAPKRSNNPKLQYQNNSAPTNEELVDDDDYFNDENFNEFGAPSAGLHDYKESYNEDFKFTPERKQNNRKPGFMNQAPKNDYGGLAKSSVSDAKLPPSLRWALEEDSYDASDSPLMYERNPKVNTHLKPIKNPISNHQNSVYSNGLDIGGTASTMYGAHDAIKKIPSIKKLSSQKTRRLQPLRK